MGLFVSCSRSLFQLNKLSIKSTIVHGHCSYVLLLQSDGIHVHISCLSVGVRNVSNWFFALKSSSCIWIASTSYCTIPFGRKVIDQPPSIYWNWSFSSWIISKSISILCRRIISYHIVDASSVDRLHVWLGTSSSSSHPSLSSLSWIKFILNHFWSFGSSNCEFIFFLFLWFLNVLEMVVRLSSL